MATVMKMDLIDKIIPSTSNLSSTTPLTHAHPAVGVLWIQSVLIHKHPQILRTVLKPVVQTETTSFILKYT